MYVIDSLRKAQSPHLLKSRFPLLSLDFQAISIRLQLEIVGLVLISCVSFQWDNLFEELCFGENNLVMGKGKGSKCELCGDQAALRCEADSANLCYKCDAHVHGINFLVARHVRVVLCCRCHQYTKITVSGSSPHAGQSFCCACCKSQGIKETSPCNSTAESAFPGAVSAASSSHSEELDVGIDCNPANGMIIEGEGNMRACLREGDNEGTGATERSEVSINAWSYSDGVSATSTLGNSQTVGNKPQVETPKKKMGLLHKRSGPGVLNAEMKVGLVLRKWCRQLNLRNPSTLPLAMDLVVKGLQKLGALSRQKIRICLAAAFWLAATLSENSAHLPPVKRLEECSGVPSKLILLAESRLGGLLGLKMQEEGSAECSS